MTQRHEVSKCFWKNGVSRLANVAVVKNLPANAGNSRDMGFICGLRRCPGTGNGNPLQYSCLENIMDRGAYPWDHKELDMTE